MVEDEQLEHMTEHTICNQKLIIKSITNVWMQYFCNKVMIAIFSDLQYNPVNYTQYQGRYTVNSNLINSSIYFKLTVKIMTRNQFKGINLLYS